MEYVMCVLQYPELIAPFYLKRANSACKQCIKSIVWDDQSIVTSFPPESAANRTPDCSEVLSLIECSVIHLVRYKEFYLMADLWPEFYLMTDLCSELSLMMDLSSELNLMTDRWSKLNLMTDLWSEFYFMIDLGSEFYLIMDL